MPKLHLVGITPDHKGLVLSSHARSKRGDLVLEIDERLLDAVEKAQRLRARDEGHNLESNALPTKRETMPGDGTAATRLSPREIQQRLRMGETVAALARSSGVDEAWIERFAPPVLAEQTRIVERARGLTFAKGRLGPSGVTLGPAVAANVIEKGVALTLPDIEAGWTAYQRHDGTWCVSFSFPYRGRRQTAEWDLDPAAKELVARNKLASDLAYREPGKKLPQPAQAPMPAPAGRPARPPAKSAKAPRQEEQVAASAVEALAADVALAEGMPPEEMLAASTPQTLPGTEVRAEQGANLPTGAAGPVTMAQRPGLAEVPHLPKAPRMPPKPVRATPAASASKAPAKKTAKKAAPAAKKAAPAAKKAAPVKKVAAAGAQPSPSEEIVQVPEPPAPVDDIPIVEPDEPSVVEAGDAPSTPADEAPTGPADEAPTGPVDEAPTGPVDEAPTGPISMASRPGPSALRPVPTPTDGSSPPG